MTMATPQGDYMKSPFDHVFSFIPQGHEKALKHALYNAVALFLLMVGTCVAYAVCFILEPFIKPLLWALLCGSVLHPFKYSLTTILRSWFTNLKTNSTPFIFGLVVIPVKFVNKISDSVGSFLHQYLFPIIGVTVALPLSVAIYHYTPRLLVCLIQLIGTYSFAIINWIVGCLNPTLLIASALAHGIYLFISEPKSSQRLSAVSCILWLAAVCCAAAKLVSNSENQAANVAVFLVAVILLVLGLAMEVMETHGVRQSRGSEASFMETLKLVILQQEIPETEETKEEVTSPEEQTIQPVVPFITSPVEVHPTPDVVDRPKKMAFRNPLTPHTLMSGRGSITLLTSTPLNTFRAKHNTKLAESILAATMASPEGLTSNHCLLAVGWACVAMLLWKHMWLLSLLPAPVALYVIKRAGSYFGVWSIIEAQLNVAWNTVKTKCEERSSTLLPPPVKGLLKIVRTVHQWLTSLVENSIDTAASCVVIVGLIVFALCTSIFIAVQVYAEGVHVVQVAAEVVNSTVVHNPELLQMLPEGIGEAVGQMLDNAYQYGREGISSMVRGLLGNQVDSVKAAQLEQQVLELWDRVYQAWVMSSNADTKSAPHGPVVSSEAVMSSWDNLVSRLTTTPELLDFSVVTVWLKTNVGTLMSLLDTVWALLKGNLSLVFGSVTTLLSILLGGGTAVLNFILSLVVFFTALFYLLSSSGALYKPVELITNFSPTNGKKFGGAFEGAVNGVFRASFKMATFYGLWTWLIHNLFQVKIVYLPSALAAMLGAVPFLGTYWASLPATLELWLAQGRGLEALLLLGCHLLPASIVDTTIYAEIRGGGHPYLTGLAVAGGILCLGVEGAIIGPLLLCCLFVAVNMSSSLMRESPVEGDDRVQAITLRQLRRNL